MFDSRLLIRLQLSHWVWRSASRNSSSVIAAFRSPGTLCGAFKSGMIGASYAVICQKREKAGLQSLEGPKSTPFVFRIFTPFLRDHSPCNHSCGAVVLPAKRRGEVFRIGLMTPLVGTGLFIAAQPAKVSAGRLFKAIVPFFIVVVLLLILLSWQPWLVTEMIK